MKLIKESLCFDDILLLPQQSLINSRKDIDISMHGYSFPIVASPMDTVCGWQMANAIANEGGIGIIHRYMSTGQRLKEFKKAIADNSNPKNVGIAISAKESEDKEFMRSAIDLGCIWFCIDTANGHNYNAIVATRYLKVRYPSIKVMVGNISTVEGYIELANVGADAVRVGIGGGATCKTRIVTGHGMPTLQSIMDCYQHKIQADRSTLIVADGGIRTSGDIVKAFAAGADLVMLGSMLAGTDESPGEIIDGYKKFRGMASAEAQVDWRGNVSVDEGISTMISCKGPVKNIFNEIKGGISSGCSYSGVESLLLLAETAEYTKVSSSSISESKPHAILV